MTRLDGWKREWIVLLLCTTLAIASAAQTFTKLVDFDGPNGALPDNAPLVQGLDGNFYGVTSADLAGTVFKVTADGKLTTLYRFCGQPNCADGGTPLAGMVLGTDGNFYGTTYYGGGSGCAGVGCGTVFKITPGGKLTTLYTFNGADGAKPLAALVQAVGGTFYGTTATGGTSNNCPLGCGTVFKITSDGVLTTLHSFDFSDGVVPLGTLLQARDGNFYGTTFQGGEGGCSNPGCGTLFKITPSGKFTTLHSFCTETNCTDGALPYGALVQDTDRHLYGTTYSGGTGLGGTAFKISFRGKLTTLYSFCAVPNCADGNGPVAGLIRATSGNFYGTTVYGGDLNCYEPFGCGTVFTVTSGGTLRTLHVFEGSDGAGPSSGLLQGTEGTFYGSTYNGGDLDCDGNGCGVVFSLDVGLGPFVAFVRDSGKVGGTGGILGEGFTGTTSVSLNGIPASFTVKSDTYIKATVPAGATSGYVTVTTPSGALTSNVPFHVIP